MNRKKPLITDEQIDDLLRSFGDEEGSENSQAPVFEIVDETEYDTDSASQSFSSPFNPNYSHYEDSSDDSESDEVEVDLYELPAAGKKGSAGAPRERNVPEAKGAGYVLKGFVILLMLLCLTWLLPSGNVMNLAAASSSTKDRDTFFQISSRNLMSQSLIDIYAMPRRYVLELSDILTPAPDKTKFTKIKDEERKNYDGTKIYYYKDETIEVKCWREKIDRCIYNFSEVWIADASQLRRTLVDNVISKKHMDFPQNIFKKTNGVVGMSADYCAFRPYGIVIQYGNVIRDKTANKLDIAIYDKMGNFSTGQDNPSFFESDIYKSGDIIHTFAFGPTLVDDYQVSTSRKLTAEPWEQPGEMKDNYPRAAICQFGYEKHYLLCTVNYRGTTAKKFAKALQQKGVRYAYNLDGGQTATLLFNKQIINKVAYGGPRQMSDILYFATAVPEK